VGRVFLVVEEPEPEPDGTERRRGHGRPRRRKKQAHSCLRFADSGGDPLHSPMHLHLHCKSALQCNTPTASVSIQKSLVPTTAVVRIFYCCCCTFASSTYNTRVLPHTGHMPQLCYAIHDPSSSCARHSCPLGGRILVSYYYYYTHAGVHKHVKSVHSKVNLNLFLICNAYI
jgi:hypothetical protein